MTSRFAALFWRQIVRASLRRPWLTALNVASIGLGVAVFLAIQLANAGALQSFRTAAALVTGKADLEIRGNIPDAVLPAVEATAGVKTATPLIEGVVVLGDQPKEYLRILGVDPISGRGIFPFALKAEKGEDFDLEQWLGDAEAVAMQQAEWQALQPWLKDGKLTVRAGNALRQLRPAFLFQPADTVAEVDPRMAAMDIGWAQEVLGRGGWLTSIALTLDRPGEAEAVAERLRKVVPGDVIVAPPMARSREMESMLGAFQLNLTAMSLVSLIVGMLLIHNSVSAAVVRRRTDIAILRALGTTRLEVRALFLAEALIEACLGTVLGLGLAPLLARVVSQPIAQSITNLYALVTIGGPSYEPAQIGEAIVLGLGAALVAAWAPAAEAARMNPARLLHEGAAIEHFSPLKNRNLVFAAVLLAAAYGLSDWTLREGIKWMAFASAGAVIAGFSLLVPWLAVAIARLGRPCGVLTRLAADHLVRSLHRNAITIASLAAAVALTVSVTVMISSFRSSVASWVDHTLVADLYISPAANDVAGFEAFLPANTLRWLEKQPEVTEVTAFREMKVRAGDGVAILTVVHGKGRGELEYLRGSPADAAQRFAAGQAVAISESLANRFHLRAGQEVRLATPAGAEAFPIAGVYRDFTSDRGVIMMPEALFARYWPDRPWHSVGVKLHHPAENAAVAERFRESFDGLYVTYDNASLRQRVFEIFDRTFAVTSILRGIAVLVAVIGVLFSLSVLVLERQREIGVLRSLGSSRRQVLGVFLSEALLLGIAACVSGLASGAVLGMILTLVLNKVFFGWTIDLAYPVGVLLTTPLWVLPAAVLAALWPAWRAARMRPAQAVRFE